MALCKFCHAAFAWASVEGRWVALVPVGEEGELLRDYQDENGALRASHGQCCTMRGGPTVRAVKLAKAVPASDVLNAPVPLPEIETESKTGTP